jgi:hypothetical protein
MRRVVMLASFLVATSVAQAQSKDNTPVQPAPKKPRIGYAASPPPEQPQQTRPPLPQVFVQNGFPFVVQADGSILANFGNGNQRVLRSCAAQQSQFNANGRDALGRIPPPPGIAALNEGTQGTIFGAPPGANAAACFRRDQHGMRVVK